MISYELPLGLSALAIIIFSGSLSFHDIVDTQGWSPLGWNLFRSPFTFVAGVIFYVAGLAEAKRLPFDLPEAESELVAGFHTEYSGMRFAFFFLAEYCAMFMLSAATAILFLGGWATPPQLHWIPGIGAIVMAIKWSALLFLMLWIRWTFPRTRLDQVMHICLKVFLPISFVCLIGAAFWLILSEVVVGTMIMNLFGWLLTIPVFIHAVKLVWKGA
jgi:NADH-quinone oxidoreductase subunit H